LKSGGSVNNKTTYQGYQNELPVIQALGDTSDVTSFVYVGSPDGLNIIIDGETGPDWSYGLEATNFSRFENIEIKNTGGTAIRGVSDVELINLNVHHNGWRADQLVDCGRSCHGLYAQDNLLIDGGRYHHNSGYGIHCYRSCHDTIIRNLRADHNRGSGIIVAFDSGVEVYNVVADNNSNGVWFAADGAIGYNITAYNNSNIDIYVSDFSNQTLENSIGLPNGIIAISGTTTSNDISGGSASSYFVDADNANFQLISTSTANNVGADLSLLHY